MEVLPMSQHVDYQKNKAADGVIFKKLTPGFSSSDFYYDPLKEIEDASCGSPTLVLAKMLEEEIRSAKRTHLSCGEVLLPCGLLQKIADDVLKIAENELYGIKGCTLYLLFEGEEDCRRLSNFKVDPTTPSTFEIYLTFKQANAGWAFLPQFLKKITRGGTVVISTEYELTKKKLYRVLPPRNK